MDFFGKYQSPFGYQNGDNGIDSYGVDHSGFSTQDELQYQTLRLSRENELANDMTRQGVTQNNYPQYGTGFWQNADLNGGGFDMAILGPSVQAALNLAKNNPTNGSAIQYAQMVAPITMTDANNGMILNQQDAIFDRVFNRTLQEEGGYEDRATHIDTPTNMGFQQATLDRFKSAHPDLARGYPDNVRDLTYEQGKQIARKDYFEKYRIGEIKSQSLQETMFDSFFNHSPQAPAYWAQKAINQNTNIHVDEDGIFGSQTIGALNNLSPDDINRVNNAILDMRQADYEHERETNTNPNYGNYTKGLADRFNRFR